MSTLRILPKNLSDMIAAGEVVQRPASVVKELMENSVDAGATSVVVNVLDAGRTLIQVIDNGSGMSADDAVLCFERHATSKISTTEDLNDIETFGFRGEALASIAAVADVTLRTRRADDEVGVEVEFAASEHLSTREVAAPSGSNFSVRNLFFNVPARRKFLKSDSVEFRHILEEFQRVALTRPEIAFTLSHNHRDVHVLKPAQGLKFRIMDLMGANVVGSVVDVSAVTSVANVEGFVGRPDAARKTVGCQFFFVNGRYFRSPYLHKAVMKAYDELIPDGTTPSYFIYLDVDPSSMDVNIHPTKTEIKFEQESVLFQVLYAAVHEALGRRAAEGSIDFEDTSSEITLPGRHFDEYRPVSIPQAGVDPYYDPFEVAMRRTEISPRGPEGLGRDDRMGPEGLGRDDNGFVISSGAGGGVEKSYRPSAYVDKSQNYGALFQDTSVPAPSRILVIKGRFIFTPSASGVMVVNIRRARERVLYERFLALMGKDGHVSQSSLFPVEVAVGETGRITIEEHIPMLRKLGFEIDPFGRDSVVVNAVPEGYSTEPAKVQAMVDDLLIALADDAVSLPKMMEQSTAQKFAVLGASTGANITNPVEAQALVDALLASENPEYTPSGRKIISIMTLDELEKLF
ncbi:MAG: DNA mismatch repair endonuclease MutL [Bacteroidales bacterium]|nr:DNA mismatch repair endonuclease MutL [Bacteroidales bacterium]